MLGLCAPLPNYVGESQPRVIGPGPLGLLDFVSGFFRSATPAYAGEHQSSQPAPGLLCSLFSTPQPVYVKSLPPPDPEPDPDCDPYPPVPKRNGPGMAK